ncbi:MAG: glutamate 5-kinase [Acidobacteriota bacterium]|nr:glutamate 5-kinase [Acidobacteriota bacterium]
MDERGDAAIDARRRLAKARRVVIKLGTSVVTGTNAALHTDNLTLLASAVTTLKKEGRQVVLVSSGAVGFGATRLGLNRARLSDVVVRQACAAVGQSLLMHAYEQLFRPGDVKIAQVLLTEDDFTDRRRYSALRQTMEKLLKLGVLPIVNENDTVSTAELEYLEGGHGRVFSDNDRLAALVMSKLEAEALVMLSDVDGLLNRCESPHEKDGKTVEAGAGQLNDLHSHVISTVEEVTPELRALATGPSAGGRGGMLTKLEAAEIAMLAGGVAVIANGQRADTLTRIFAGEQVGTVFSSHSRMAGKRRWIAYAANVHGRLIVNDGARAALVGSKASLLSSGVVRIESHFAPHDVISIADTEGREFARGIANCDSAEAENLIGDENRQSPRAKPRVLVARDNIVLLKSDK